uniref:MADF domain-containing protein n=1 Tax=Loa loa TaxID=7209 RepID=A0A1I7V7J8_LOALO
MKRMHRHGLPKIRRKIPRNKEQNMSNETIVWTDAMREVLIKSVQRQECIWNFSNVDYRNAAKKRQIFWEIAQEMSEMFGIILKG